MTQRSVIIVFIIFFAQLNTSAQNLQVIDSLQKAVKIAPDSLKASLYNQISWEYRNSNIPKCMQYAREASQIARENNRMKDYIVAISFMGVAYRNISDYPKALDYYFEALELSKKIEDKEQIAYSLNNIGNIYIYQDNYNEALRYIEKTKVLAEALKDSKLLGYSYLNLGRIYKNLNQFDKALEYLNKTLEIRQKLGDLQSIGSAKYDLGEAYMLSGDYDKALEYFFESIEILEQVGDKDGQSFCYNNIAKIYLKKEYYASALTYARKGLQISRTIGSKYEQKKANYILSEIFYAQEQYAKAFDYLKSYVKVNDSIFSQESLTKIAQFQVKAELEKQEAQIELLMKDKTLQEEKVKRVRQLVYFFVSLMILILLITYNVYRNYREKKRINDLLKEQKEEIEAQRDTIENERQKSEQLLLNILPDETAFELKEKGHANTRSYEQVTVMFADLIDFSSKSEQMDPQKLIDELNECFILFDEITEKYNIEKIKTIGDAYMCAGGIPTWKKDSAAKTVMAALEMQQLMLKWKEEKVSRSHHFWEMRVGIHTGPVIGGVIGKRKFAYDIWGNTVNIASRLESAGEAGMVNISEFTYQLIKDHFHCEHRGKIAAKNIGEIDMYFVISKKE